MTVITLDEKWEALGVLLLLRGESRDLGDPWSEYALKEFDALFQEEGIDPIGSTAKSASLSESYKADKRSERRCALLVGICAIS